MSHHLIRMPDQPNTAALDTSKIGGLEPSVAAFLRHRYARNRSDLVDSELGVSARTNERWLAGDDPPSWRIEAMLGLWGEPLMREGAPSRCSLIPSSYPQPTPLLDRLPSSMVTCS